MILIADSGSTKTEWRLFGKDHIESYNCRGLNPYFNNNSSIINELKTIKNRLKDIHIDEIHFYGAGLTDIVMKDKIEMILSKFFANSEIKVYDDLTAAGRALFQDGTGLACILGTGSNSCFYEEGLIKPKIPSLGYILGDEGSGADIGKQFINALLKKDLSPDLIKMIYLENNINTEDILRKTYKEALPNRYLASFSKIIRKYESNDEIRQIIYSSFKSFINKNVKKYKDYKMYDIGFVGSVAFNFKEILLELVKAEGFQKVRILEKPIEELTGFHLKIKKNRK